MHHPKVAHPQLSHVSRVFFCIRFLKCNLMEKTGQKTLMFMSNISKNVIKTNSFNIFILTGANRMTTSQIFFPKESLKNAGRPPCDPAD